MRMPMGAAPVDNGMGLPPEMIRQLPSHPGIAPLGLYRNDTEALIQRDACGPMWIAELFRRAKLWKQPKGPQREERIQKTW